MKTYHMNQDNWIESIPDGLILPCNICNQKVHFDYKIDNYIWNEISKDKMWRLSVICLKCADNLCKKKNIDITQYIENIFFCGNQKTIKLEPTKIYYWNLKK